MTIKYASYSKKGKIKIKNDGNLTFRYNRHTNVLGHWNIESQTRVCNKIMDRGVMQSISPNWDKRLAFQVAAGQQKMNFLHFREKHQLFILKLPPPKKTCLKNDSTLLSNLVRFANILALLVFYILCSLIFFYVED